MGFGFTSWVCNGMIDFARIIARQFGYEMAVVASDHSLNVKMVNPGDNKARAWDPSLYRHGNLFVEGYANPVKLTVDYNEELKNPNEIDIEESEDGDEYGHTDVISSPRYREYMRQDLISQVLNPQEQWKKLLYALAGVGVLVALSLVSSMSAAGFI